MSIEWERSVDGKKLEEFLALMDGVQGELDVQQFEMQVRAEENLQRVKASPKTRGSVSQSSIETERGRVDRYVILQDITKSDSASVNSAMSIEVGRGAYDVTLLSPDGETVSEYTVAGFEGLYILANAAKLPRKNKGGSRTKRHVTIRRKKGVKYGRPSRRD
ncbi:hypothetical protein F0344_12455 [Streptomyces finlayi]|uniref:Uncharacterized protein n=1 Tax=Streptomyces finlayi TaxID=67296 RepID=A0A7G7BJ05_9ACTN|nr:hypothetical protein [Streptomyces finlayi]QNE75320.1 hypothetical protein F0344_12455 [Streptomyces finlayi]